MSLYDENAAVLRDIAAAGDNLRKPRSMDFNHLFPTREGAIAFARRVEAEGFTPVVRPYDNLGYPFDVTGTTQAVIPTCDFITATEQRLATMAAEHDGCADGWGCMKPERVDQRDDKPSDFMLAFAGEPLMPAFLCLNRTLA